MRNALMFLALAPTGCNGTSPEVYSLVVSHFSLPDSCYTSGMQPSTVVTTTPPGLIQVSVYDGPDNTAFLDVEKGGGSIDMGAAPNVNVNGVFTGKKVDKGWQFASDSVTKQTLPGNNVVTATTHAEIVFERFANTFKGTVALSSSSNCVGNQCPGANPSCSVSAIDVQGTRIAVQYERAP